MNGVESADLEQIVAQLSSKWKRLADKTLLLSGCGGFLGYYLTSSLALANDRVLRGSECRLIGIDNFPLRVPSWVDRVFERPEFRLVRASIVDPLEKTLGSLEEAGKFQYFIHAASIASPAMYRRFPIETLEVNVLGLKNMLQEATRAGGLESGLFLSSSEVYGDPPPEHVPTPETYWGNVSFTGPRACYDESKRLGETLCVDYHRIHKLPVKVVRPFNNYGPGLDLADGRVMADVLLAVLEGRNIILYSNGKPTRTFCYVADAVAGYWQALLSDHDGEAFNIGSDEPEISVGDLAELVLEVAREELGMRDLSVIFKKSPDPAYLEDNPQRRCPSLEKAKRMLGYEVRVGLREGIGRTLRWHLDGR